MLETRVDSTHADHYREPPLSPGFTTILAVGTTLIGIGVTLIGLLLALWRDARNDTQALREEVRADRQNFRAESRAGRQSLREVLQAITQLIVERFQPEQVILFGSVARGEEDENSDLDLMVVLRPGVEPPRRGNPIRRAIAEHFLLPVDLLFRSYETFTTYRPNPKSTLSRMREDFRGPLQPPRRLKSPGSPNPTSTS